MGSVLLGSGLNISPGEDGKRGKKMSRPDPIAP